MAAATDVPLLPRLLVGVGDRPTSRLECHLDLHGTLPDLGRWAPEQVITMFEQAGIRGRGGASFPVAAKMRAVASCRWSKAVAANGSEGEPASKKVGRCCAKCRTSCSTASRWPPGPWAPAKQ